ncbi:MAG TPA: LysM peptidoglycan-binding domain-containing protein [Bacteroidia bacterium]|jgi:membrane-bound lytic murein transglycosylase D|nr:LysM peptidoglycan-binding domain-containing protein [Bacteroidia bacterium]
MKKSPFFFFIIFFFCFLGLPAVSQNPATVSPAPVSQETLQDDPIAAALDSLYSLNLFEKGYAKVNYSKTSKFNFSPDSVPHYEESVYASRLAQIDANSPFDLQYNSVVKGYIQLYTVRRRELVSRMMALSQFYFPIFEQQLDRYNLPLELKYLAICESALNPMARSHAGAMGLWQFMYPTGKMYGLKVSSYVDERCDPYKSTEAACQYLKYLYTLFGDWQMVLAAYNGGPGTVNKAIRRSGGKKTYWEIRPFLPKETQGYVPAFIAVNYVMNYTAEHNLYSATPKKIFLEVDTISITKQVSLRQIASILGIAEDELQYLNPSYRKGVIPFVVDEKNILTLPADKLGVFIMNEERIYNLNGLVTEPLTSESILAKEPQIIAVHRVKKGEKLSSIANRYGCTLAQLKQWNNIKGSAVPAGKKLNIYSVPTVETATKSTVSGTDRNEETKNSVKQNESESSKTVAETKPAETVKPAEGYKFYTIQKGDTLYKIAKKQKTTIEEIKRLNNFSTKYMLIPGKKIKVGEL